MALTSEQVDELKEQLRAQIQQLPEEQREQAEKHIDTMSPEALELMLKQQQARAGSKNDKTIFRMLVDRDIEANIIEESKEAIAVLDINPISKGHALIIPKEAVSEKKMLPKPIFAFAEKLAKRIIKILSAKTAELQTEYKFGEIVLHIIPIYDHPLTLGSERHKASPEELKTIAQKLAPAPPVVRIRKNPKQTLARQLLRLPRRIP